MNESKANKMKAREEKMAERENKPRGKFGAFIKKHNTKKKRIIFIIIIVIILALVINSAIKSNKDKMAIFDVNPSYDVAYIGDISYSIAGDGNLSTGSSLTFLAETDLSIDNVLIQEGQSVNAGDVIATLNAEKMQDNLLGVEYELNDMQATVDASYRVEDTYYIKAPVSGRFKDVQVEEEDLVEEAMADPGYLALISTVDELKIAVSEDEYKMLEKEKSLVIRTESHKYEEDIELRRIDKMPYVILPNAIRTIGAEAKIYSASATKEGKELATGKLELISFEMVKGTYGMISYQDDFENYTIDKGEVLFHVDQFKYTLANSYAQLAKLREEYELISEISQTLVLTAPYDGIITSLSLSDDSYVAKDSVVAMIKSEDDWTATVAVDELDINKVMVGHPALVTIDALDFLDYPATVKSISSAGAASGGITTYDVVLSVDDNEAFKLAMSLTSEIDVESAKDAVLVPVSSIRTLGDKRYVMVSADRTLEEQNEIKKAILASDIKTLSKYMGDVFGAMPGQEDRKDENVINSTDKSKVDFEKLKTEGSFGINMISNPVELLYGDIRIVKVGIEGAISSQIISGLTEGEEILLPIVSYGDFEIEAQSSGGMGMRGFGGGAGGGK